MNRFIIFLFLIVNVSMADRLDQALDICSSRDWDQIVCEYEEAPEEYISNFWDTNLYTPVIHVGFGIRDRELLKNIIAEITPDDFFIDIPYKKDDIRDGYYKRKEFLSSVKSYLKKQKMSRCQKACFGQCLASNFLIARYHFENEQAAIAKDGNLVDIYEQGYGECTEFSRFAVDVMKSIGLKASVQSALYDLNSGGHAFVKVRVGLKTYFMEPQADDCTFYKKVPLYKTRGMRDNSPRDFFKSLEGENEFEEIDSQAVQSN